MYDDSYKALNEYKYRAYITKIHVPDLMVGITLQHINYSWDQ